MPRAVKLSRLSELLADLEYPATAAEAAAAVNGVTLLPADGETDLGAAIRSCASERFADADELETELYAFLPIEAVGEPGQSEGDA
jgi:hypothetical protein